MRSRLDTTRSSLAHLLVDDLTIARGSRTVLQGVSFSIAPGEAVQVTGQNGAGKSTLLRAICGFLPWVSGAVRWTGPEGAHRADAPTLAESVHYVGHADGLKTALTARENIEIAAALSGGVTTSPDLALKRLDLPHVIDIPVGYLSAGQRRRVALARLLTAHRPLWLLDEPATALDRAAQAMLAEIMTDHLTSGGLILASTHAPLDLPGLRDLWLEP
ncbi:heme ABC exporter ATP-binding protein CcmA [Lichenihabitans psoromatis]|uniref:heme ABC exporter ATP-binding protein CcmA n=1 Tax=Lichenihabitans psoromatis TaxID=2528642 RepID=UPI001038440D|nr:heme ABC exporter ATP-binding protein CcmA [Lichenihabitans psoromatis]